MSYRIKAIKLYTRLVTNTLIISLFLYKTFFMSNIKLFESKQIRSIWNEKERKWYFSIQDVVEVLTNSADIKQYIKRILSRDEQLKSNWGTICTLVEMVAADGKKRKVQAANAQGLLRIIQSIPSPKAEPFKLWLAKVGSY